MLSAIEMYVLLHYIKFMSAECATQSCLNCDVHLAGNCDVCQTGWVLKTDYSGCTRTCFKPATLTFLQPFAH